MLCETELERLTSLTQEFSPGQVIIKEGDHNADLYILLSGEVEVIKGRRAIATISERGAMLGEMSTLLKKMRTASVRVTKFSKIIVVPESAVDRFFEKAPQLGWKVAKQLAQRLEETTFSLYAR